MIKIRRFLDWPAPKKKLIFQVFFEVVSTRVSLWLVPLNSLDKNSFALARSKSASLDREKINEIVGLVRYCCRFVPYATCLTQALATKRVLRRHGQNCVLRIGVDKIEGDKFRAHAWIELDGRIIIGKVRDLSRYSVMNRSEEQYI